MRSSGKEGTKGRSGQASLRSVLARFLGRGHRPGQGTDVREGPLDGFLAADAFEHLLLKERARADRAGSAFTVLVFDTSAWFARDGGETAVALVGGAIAERVRLSDTLGWFGRNLAVLVPDADAQGAEAVARDVCRSFQQSRMSLNGKRSSFMNIEYVTLVYQGEDHSGRTVNSDACKGAPDVECGVGDKRGPHDGDQ